MAAAVAAAATMVARFLDRMCLALWDGRTMAPLRYAAKFDPFLSLDCARVEGVGVEGITFCHLATLAATVTQCRRRHQVAHGNGSGVKV